MDLGSLDRYPRKEEFVAEARKRARAYDLAFHGCSQAVVQTFLDLFAEENPALFMAASPFAAGMSMTGNNCGALIGGLMVLGVFFGRQRMSDGMEGIIEGIRPARRLVRYFQGANGSLQCRDITRTDLADPVKADAYFAEGGLDLCAGITGDVAGFVAELLYDEKTKREKKTHS